VLAAVFVLAAGVLGALGNRWWQADEGPGAAPGPVTSAGRLVPAPNPSPIGGFSPRVCDAPVSGTLPLTPARGARRTAPNGYAMSPDWSYQRTGEFGVAVPDGWTYRTVGTTWCFRGPDGVRVLSVDSARKPGADPVAACRAEATRLTDAGLLPGYRQIQIAPVTYFGRAADREYRYRNAAGTTLHARVLWFDAGGRAYALSWVTREFDWTTGLAYLNLIRSSFGPGPA
jgi:eukaryotic-like serine/threonine-protein kinase